METSSPAHDVDRNGNAKLLSAATVAATGKWMVTNIELLSCCLEYNCVGIPSYSH